METEQALLLIVGIVTVLSLVTNIVQAVINGRSVPVDVARDAITRLRVYAGRTDTPLDDILLDTADDLVDVIEDMQDDEGVTEEEVFTNVG